MGRRICECHEFEIVTKTVNYNWNRKEVSQSFTLTVPYEFGHKPFTSKKMSRGLDGVRFAISMLKDVKQIARKRLLTIESAHGNERLCRKQRLTKNERVERWIVKLHGSVAESALLSQRLVKDKPMNDI